MKKLLFYFLFAILTACSTNGPKKDNIKSPSFINETTIKTVIDTVKSAQPESDIKLLEKGIKHAASLWRQEDGTAADFSVFVKKNYISDPAKRKLVFKKISNYIESLTGYR